MMEATAKIVAAISLGSIILFVIIAVLVSNGLTEQIDSALMLSMRDAAQPDNPWGPKWFEETAAEITALGGYPIIAATVFVVTCILLLLRLNTAAAFLVGSIISGSVVSTLLKQVFARPRPDLVEHLDRIYTSSFPSAHAMVSTVAWLTLAAIAIRFVTLHRLRIFILWGGATIAILVGISRVYLGVHWPSDVLAGWCVGIFWAGICWLAAHYYQRQTEPDVDLGHSRT